MQVPLSKSEVKAVGEALYHAGKRPPVTWNSSSGADPTDLKWWNENPNDKEPSGFWKKAGIRTYLICSNLAENSSTISPVYVSNDGHHFWPDRAIIKTALRDGFAEPTFDVDGELSGFVLTPAGQQWIEE